MLTNIRMKPGFMYLGTTPTTCSQEVPMPTGDNTFKTAYNWQTQQSADGSIVGQQRGRSRSTQDLNWGVMDCNTWWNLNQWIEANGMCFYARYFNYNFGIWQTRQFYVDSITCVPYRPASAQSSDHGNPLYLKECKFTVYDMGVI